MRERKQVYDIMKFISIDYYINGACFSQVPRKRFVNTASNEEKKQFQKRLRKERNNLSPIYLKITQLQ